MKAIIKEELVNIESQYNVKILYACESGSRAWGFPSRDSDYDVRFIYVNHPDWYLSIDEKRDVIELPINDLLDINGWDIRKALKLFRKSNPPLQEWLRSAIIYEQKYSFIDQLKKLESEMFSPVTCLYHYLSMAKGNYRDYLQGEQVKIKKYFYVLRPLLACKWIEKHNIMPPISFHDLVKDASLECKIREEIDTLLTRKINGDELDIEPRIDVINQYIENEFSHLEDYIKSVKHVPVEPTSKLDQLFRHTLSEVWGSKIL